MSFRWTASAHPRTFNTNNGLFVNYSFVNNLRGRAQRSPFPSWSVHRGWCGRVVVRLVGGTRSTNHQARNRTSLSLLPNANSPAKLKSLTQSRLGKFPNRGKDRSEPGAISPSNARPSL